MNTLTLKFPQRLAQQVQACGISQEALSKICIQLIEFYIEEMQKSQSDISCPLGTSAESGLPDGAEFARRLIDNNKELFEELARL